MAVLSTVASWSFNHVAGPAASELAQPLTREASYFANEANPNLMPGIGDCINAYWRNESTQQYWREWLAYLGVARPDDPSFQDYGIIWNKIIESKRPAINLRLVLAANQLGIIDDASVRRQMLANGLYNESYWQTYKDMLAAPDPADVMVNEKLGRLTAEQASNYYKLAGLGQPGAIDTFKGLTQAPSVGRVLDLYRSGYLPANAMYSCLDASGQRYAPYTVAEIEAAEDNLPGINQIMAIAQSGAASATDSANLGLYDEVPALVKKYSAHLGMFRPMVALGGQVAGSDTKSWAEAIWASTRAQLTPAEAVEASRRLRPDPTNPAQSVVPGQSPFGRLDLVAAMQRVGYTSKTAGQIASISNKLLTRFDIRSGVRYGTMTDDRVISAFLDLGLSEADANLRLRTLKLQEEERLASWRTRIVDAANHKIVADTLEAYKVGITTAEQCLTQLTALGFTDSQARGLVAEQNSAVNHAMAVEAVKAIENAYMSGALADGEVMTTLAGAGITATRAGQYVQEWSLRRHLPHRISTIAEIKEWLANGYLSEPAATARLINLGIRPDDIPLHLASAERKLQNLQQRAIAADQRSNNKRAADLGKVQRNARKLVKDTQAEIKRITPVSKLQKWVSKGIVTDNFFRQRMIAAGYPTEAIDLYLKDAHDKSTKVRGSPKGSTQQAQPGPTAPNIP